MYVLARSHKYRIALQGYGNILPSAVTVSLEGDCRIVTFVALCSVLISLMQRAYVTYAVCLLLEHVAEQHRLVGGDEVEALVYAPLQVLT